MPEPNRLLRAARERTPSRRVRGTYMSREELAEAVALWAADCDDKHRDAAFDANHLGKLERGTVRVRMAGVQAPGHRQDGDCRCSGPGCDHGRWIES